MVFSKERIVAHGRAVGAEHRQFACRRCTDRILRNAFRCRIGNIERTRMDFFTLCVLAEIIPFRKGVAVLLCHQRHPARKREGIAEF